VNCVIFEEGEDGTEEGRNKGNKVDVGKDSD
jgi:hypothetical protein